MRNSVLLQEYALWTAFMLCTVMAHAGIKFLCVARTETAAGSTIGKPHARNREMPCNLARAQTTCYGMRFSTPPQMLSKKRHIPF